MARAIWKGYLTLGRIAIPVGLASTHKDGAISLRTLHRADAEGEVCGRPIEQPRSCPEHGAIEDTEVAKAWEITPGQFVLIEKEELAQVAPDTTSRRVDLLSFVAAGDVDPVVLEKAYFLTPHVSHVGQRSYALLAETLREEGLVALGRFAAWDSEQVCCVRPIREERALALHVLRPVEDALDPSEIEAVLADVELAPEELRLAGQLVRRLYSAIGDVDLANRHRARVQALLSAKLAEEPLPPTEPQRPEPIVEGDLAGALKRSLREAPPRAKRRPKARAAAKA